MYQLSYLKLYSSILIKSVVLTMKNISALILFALYSLILYLGIFFFLEKNYLVSTAIFLLFSFCISSIFYITGQIVKYGRFSFDDLIISFRIYYFRVNFLFIFWFSIYFFINQFIITPVSSFVKGDILLYFVIIPAILLIFLIFNTFPESVYLSDENIESIFISSIKFMEKHWLVWILPTVVILFLLNFFDHRISIMPTFGHLDSEGIIHKIQDISFYIRTLILTIALVFRGLLFKKITESESIIK